MRHILLAGIALFLSSQAYSPADETKDAANGPVAREFAAIKKKFEAEEKDLKKKLDKAEGAEDKKQAGFLLKELSAITASDAVELALNNPKDDAAVDAAVFALKLLGQFKVTGGDMDKASDFILENHINSPKIQGALAQMSETGPTGEKFLKTVAEKTTNKEVKGLALYYRAIGMGAEIAEQEDNGNEEAAKKTRAEAVAMLAKAVELCPQAKVGEQTLAKAAESDLAALKIGVGNPVPDVEGINLDGNKVKLSSLKGKVVLFDFWATWCGPCRAMIPHERDLVDKMSKKPFTLLSVNVDEEKSALTDFLENEKMPWSHWWDGSHGPIGKKFRIHAFPTLFLIDAKGIVRKKWIGSPGEKVLDKAVEELVAEAEKK